MNIITTTWKVTTDNGGELRGDYREWRTEDSVGVEGARLTIGVRKGEMSARVTSDDND